MTTKEHTQITRTAHHRALETLRAPHCERSGLQLWRKTREIERLTHAGATAYCNGERIRITWPLFGSRDYDFGRDGCEAWDQLSNVAADCLRNIYGQVPSGVFFNADARGHTIKLDSEKATIPDGMQKDWGSDGILAAEIG